MISASIERCAGIDRWNLLISPHCSGCRLRDQRRRVVGSGRQSGSRAGGAAAGRSRRRSTHR
jgi:hypothetical protein